MDLTPGRRGNVDPPLRDATFADKMDYYRAQHTTRGVRLTHLVAIPGVLLAVPLLLVRPRRAVSMLVASLGLQVAGHIAFERNDPGIGAGDPSYALCGLAFWCEEVTDLVSGRGIGGSDHPVVRLPDTESSASRA